MTITDVKIDLSGRDGGRLLAYAKITLDNAYVVHDLKVLRGSDGEEFVGMPARKVQDLCPSCRACKNPLKAAYCNACGGELNANRSLCKSCQGSGGSWTSGVVSTEGEWQECQLCKGYGWQCLYQDTFHPIRREARRYLETVVLEAYHRALLEESRG